MNQTATRTYTVEGMTCHHCQLSVSEEVGDVEGVEDVSVDLHTGLVEVRGAEVSDSAVRAAVEDAGYRLAGER